MPLTISRKPGQAVVLDGPAVVRVTKTKGGQATLRFENADGTTIVREEVPDERLLNYDETREMK